jgi:DNA-binding winged helix-turn-helix (wHTH) protein
LHNFLKVNCPITHHIEHLTDSVSIAAERAQKKFQMGTWNIQQDEDSVSRWLSKWREATMTSSALMRFVRGRRTSAQSKCEARPSTLDTDQSSFGRRLNPVVPARIEIAFGSYRLFPAQFLLLDGDRQVPLGSRALEILGVLLERPSELVSKQELMARVWPDVHVEPANLTVHISALRRMLHDGRDGNRFIINVPGRGYSFVGSFEVSEHASPAPCAAHRGG